VQILHDVQELGPGSDHAVTIGTYDGVHIGHRTVIDATRRLAEQRGLKLAVVTFHPHPASVLRPESAPLMLTDIDQRLDLLDRAGVDTTLVIPFDIERAQDTAEDFVRTVLVDCVRARVVAVGDDFHFGKGREGNVEVLTELGRRFGFEVVGLDLVAQPDGAGESVSSTAIRQAIAEGDVVTAARLLGRYHEVRGPVVAGDMRGRTIGFPTANVAVPRNRALPADAVYAGWYIRPDGVIHPTAINLGKRPTFYQEAEHSLLEAHLLDFDGDLYGEEARVCFVDRLRGEQRFDGIDALKAQLDADIARAREVLSRALPPAG
jgi:riboflavin kinase/FMN adenylyltransferase